jgi:hypothetical protein
MLHRSNTFGEQPDENEDRDFRRKEISESRSNTRLLESLDAKEHPRIFLASCGKESATQFSYSVITHSCPPSLKSDSTLRHA